MRIARVLLTVLLLALLGAGGWLYLQLHSLSGGASPGTLATIAQNPRTLLGKDRVLVMVVGRDYNHTRQGIAYSTGSRADTIMLVSLDFATGKAAAVSVPRDTYVAAPDGVGGKINATLSRGGVELLTETLERTFGLEIDHHVLLKDTAVKNIVDALGGVWVETIDEMKYKDSWGGLNIDLPAGRQFINGEQAVGFVRFREVNRYRIDQWGNTIWLQGVRPSKEEGDLRRTERQQQLLRSMSQAALTPQNLVRLSSIADVAFGEIQTDLTRPQMLALGRAVAGGGATGLRSTTIPGEGGLVNGAYYFYPDRQRAQAFIDYLLEGDEAAGRRLVAVRVYNASASAGVARATAEVLRQQDYGVASVNTADEKLAASKLTYRTAAVETQARAIQALLGVPALEKDPTLPEGIDVEVRIGDDLAAGLLAKVQ